MAVVEEAVEGQMFGPYPRPRVVRLLRYVAAKWLHRPAGWSNAPSWPATGTAAPTARARATTVEPRRADEPRWRLDLAQHRRVLLACNNRKGDRLLPETSLRLAWQPWVPRHADLLA